MSKFTTRVELHDPGDEDYETLHSEMKKKGFSRFISVDGTWYHMPWAEYNLEGSYTKSQVSDLASKAASMTECDSYGILVTESAGRHIAGLIPAK